MFKGTDLQLNNNVNISNLQLSDVVDLKVLKEIQSCYSDATGLGLLFVDAQGRQITEISRCIPFCEKLRKSPFRHTCEQSDALAGMMALRSHQPYIYRCHMGFVDVAVPVIVNNQYFGAIFTGQILTDKEDMESLDTIFKPPFNIKDYPELEESYKKTLDSCQVLPLQKIKASARLVSTLANHIAEIGINKFIQHKLNEQNTFLKQQIKARSELENALTEAELRALRAQINPHFLFNSLNTISRLALLEEATKTQESIFALAELLRVSLKKSDQNVTIKEEVDYVRNYLLIKEIHLRKNINIEFNIEGSCLNKEIPLFTLQPLVENALIHGIEPKEEGGRISIMVARKGHTIQIEVIDDGFGMPPHVIEKVQQLKNKSTGKCNLTGLGIRSVIQRLQYHFGDTFKWELSSMVGKGTRITLIIPG